jgi:protein-L-isoaspartate(D-aspartate) O-methyltransferase
MMDLDARRRFFAEEIEAVANLATTALVEALAAVPRERFLRAGPWLTRGEGGMGSPLRQTPDADPRHTYHNCAVAIDPARQLFNGAPSVVAGAIDRLWLAPGARVLHVGAGLGYYTALLAHIVGASGRVLAIEVDPTLAAEAAVNLASTPWVEPRCGDGTDLPDERFDAMLVNAGVTHPQAVWLDSLAPGGRLILPLTVSMPEMEATLGKGILVLLVHGADEVLDAHVLNFVAIYSAIGLRDDAANAQLGQAMRRAPFPRLRRLRRDPHEAGPECWLHGAAFCLSQT